MGFNKKEEEQLLVETGRYCCICKQFKGVKIRVHHIVKPKYGGTNDIDNAIPLCQDCHDDMGYDQEHPSGKKYTKGELIGHRESTKKSVKEGKLPRWGYVVEQDTPVIEQLKLKEKGLIELEDEETELEIKPSFAQEAHLRAVKLALEAEREKEKGNNDKACSFYEAALTAFSDDHFLYLSYANLLQEIGDIDKARKIWQEGLKIIDEIAPEAGDIINILLEKEINIENVNFLGNLALVYYLAEIREPTHQEGKMLSKIFETYPRLIEFFLENIKSPIWFAHIDKCILDEYIEEVPRGKDLEKFFEFLIENIEQSVDEVLEYILLITKINPFYADTFIRIVREKKIYTYERTFNITKEICLRDAYIPQNFFHDTILKLISEIAENDPIKSSLLFESWGYALILRKRDVDVHAFRHFLEIILKINPRIFLPVFLRLTYEGLIASESEFSNEEEYKKGYAKLLYFGKTSSERELRGDYAHYLHELLISILHKLIEEIVKSDPEIIRITKRDFLDRNFAMGAYLLLEGMSAAPSIFKYEILKMATSEKYATFSHIEYALQNSIREAYKFWNDEQKRKWLDFILHSDHYEKYGDSGKYYLNVDLIQSVKTEERSDELNEVIENLNKDFNIDDSLKPSHPIGEIRGGIVTSPFSKAELENMTNEELKKITRKIMSGDVGDYDFLKNSVSEFGREIAQLIAQNIKKYHCIIKIVCEECKNPEFISSFIFTIRKHDIETSKMIEICSFFDNFEDSNIKIEILRCIEKTLRSGIFDNNDLDYSEKELIEFSEDFDPSNEISVDHPLRSFEIGYNSVRGNTLICLELLYTIRPNKTVKDKILTLSNDPHPAVRACTIKHLGNLWEKSRELADIIITRYLEGEYDESVIYPFLMYFSGPLYPEYKNESIAFWERLLDSKDLPTREAAFKLCLYRYVEDENFNNIVTSRIKGGSADNDFKKWAVEVFSSKVTDEKKFPRVYSLLLELADDEDKDVFDACFEVLNNDMGDKKPILDRDNEIFPKIIKFLEKIAVRISGDITSHQGFLTWRYIDYIVYNAPKYLNKCVGLLLIAARPSGNLITNPWLRERIISALGNILREIGIPDEHKAEISDLLLDFTRDGDVYSLKLRQEIFG